MLLALQPMQPQVQALSDQFFEGLDDLPPSFTDALRSSIGLPVENETLSSAPLSAESFELKALQGRSFSLYLSLLVVLM